MRPIGAGKEEIDQVENILARFPGPVTLNMTLNRRLLGLLVCVCITALFAWFLMTSHRYRWYDWIMQPLGLMLFAGFTIRAVILLLVPSAGSLTLSAHGFEIGHVFYRISRSWRHVSDFSVERRYYARYGWHRHVLYDVIESGSARGAKGKIVTEFCGRPRLQGDVLAWLMNAWRERALALPSETSVPVVPRAD
jgi:hypothetical protein